MIGAVQAIEKHLERRELEHTKQLAQEGVRLKAKHSWQLKQRAMSLSKYDPSNLEILELDVAIMALELM